MTIKGKPSYTVDDDVVLAQCLNNASQSLHNLYEFFKEAGEEHVDIFFNQVRFFSAVSTVRGVNIRSHRVCRVSEDSDDITTLDVAEQDGQSPEMEDYPLQFEYDDYFRAVDAEFTRENVVKTFEHILVGYGTQVLSKCIREAADVVVKKCYGYFKEHEQRIPIPDGFYSHGQEPPQARYRTSLATQPSRESTVAFEQSDTTHKRRRYT
ncbi:hypothetical protein F4802DRAFT_584444 [Xylaria palmicola]|nr:hypothetical protein F4802DRAFT_584444 [Xylaria palmicola]